MTKCRTREQRRRRHFAVVSLTAAVAAGVAATFVMGTEARAADGTWTGNADPANYLWVDPANWLNGVIPGSTAGAAGTSADVAIFNTPGGGEGTDILIDANRNVAGITFDIAVDPMVGGSGQTVASATPGNTLYLSAGGLTQVTANNNTTSSPAINPPIVLLGNYTFRNNSTTNSSGLKLGSSITNGSAGPITLTLDGVNYVTGSAFSSNNQWTAPITDGPGGSISVVKNGNGTWDLRAPGGSPNTYSGDTVINEGAIRFNGTGALSPNSNYIVNEGGSFRPSMSGTIKSLTVNSPNGYHIPGEAAPRAPITESGGAVISINTETGPAITFDMSTATAAVSMGVPVNLIGAGAAGEGGFKLIVSDTTPKTSYTRNIDLGSVNRLFDIGQSAANVTAGDPDLQLNNPISGSGGIIKIGPGTLKFQNVSNPFSGTLEVRQGTVRFDTSNALTSQPPVLIAGGRVLLASDQLQTFGPVTVTRGELTGGNNAATVSAPTYAVNIASDDTARLDVVLADGAAPANLTKSGGGSATIEVAPTYTGATTVNGGTLSLVTSMTSSSSVSVSGGTLQVAASNTDALRVLKTGGISITGSGRIDITRHRLITSSAVGTANGTTYTGVQGLVQAGASGGAWNGSGIITSQGDAATGLTSIGVGNAGQILGIGPAATDLFSGETVTGSDTIAMYTYKGDANLDGFISADDYTAIDFAIAQPGASGWSNGDFNWDGFISADDYTAIDFNLVAQGAPFPTSGSGLSGVTAVPEPASACGFAILGLGLLTRRRRHRSDAGAR